MSLLTLPICSYILFTLSIGALSILFIVVLNCWSDNSNILATSGSDACFVSQIVFLYLLAYLVIFF